MNTNRHRKRLSASGFSLIELIAVMTIMTVMLALSAPALSSFKDTVGRKGAINQLLNSFEQARVAALTQGTKVYVGFADENFPENLRYKAYIIFRDGDTDKGEKSIVPLTKWINLPKGISFKKEENSIISNNLAVRVDIPDSKCLPYTEVGKISALTFNSSGFIDTDKAYLRLLIYEGFTSANGQVNFTREDKAYFDMIGFRRYSGKAELFTSPRS